MPDDRRVGTRVQFWHQRIRQLGRRDFIRQEFLGVAQFDSHSPDRALVLGILDRQQLHVEDLAWLQVELEQHATGGISPDELPAVIRAAWQARNSHGQELARRRQEQVRDQLSRRAADEKARRTQQLTFLGRGVSAGLRYEGGDATRIERLGMPQLAAPADLATALGIETGTLAWLTYHRGVTSVDHYHRFTIPKRSGGSRVISAPKQQLRRAQRWIHDAILTRVPLHERAMAFRSGRSIVQNARAHVNRAVVIRIDLQNFFPSISFRRVKGVFVSLGYNEGIATLLALLATEAPRAEAQFGGRPQFVALGDRRLPQGGCASPGLANIVCRKLDARLAGIADGLGFTYTRFADDLVFSHAQSNASIGALIALATRIVREEGFTVNADKTHVMRPQHRQVVTGLIVNGRDPRVPRMALRRFRAVVHQSERDGIATMSARLGQSALGYTSGFLAFVNQVDGNRAHQIRAAHVWIRRPSGDPGSA